MAAKIYLYNPETGVRLDVPTDKEKLDELLFKKGFGRYTFLVRTSDGAEVPVLMEGQVHNGQLDAHLLSQTRVDPGHEKTRAFVTVEEWEKMSEDEKNALLRARRAPTHTHQPKGDLAAEVVLANAENARLRKELDALKSSEPEKPAKPPKGK